MSTLNIFVSGTIDDQRAERNTVGAAVESLRLDATRAETQYSSEHSSRDECLKMARECNVYLGVYTQTRYGWIIPADGISVTELEFNEAQRLKKPTLIFIQKLPKDWTPKDDKEKEQREKQKAFLNRVLDFDGGKFRAAEFEALTQLENQVAGSLMQLLVERFKLTVTRPPFLAPRNLDVFVGRVAQIEELTCTLTRNVGKETGRITPPLLVHGFYGVGGLGKTALALQIAHTLRGQFDGGVLWADLPTVRPDQTLADWAREYGQDISRIEETDARADAVRAILSGRRVLAFLDGAVDESDDEKIAPLLRALADCAVIVTSRVTQLNSLANARRVNLDKMSEDEAVELFNRVGAFDKTPLHKTPLRDQIIAIARVVDFLPLALDLAAAQWREHSSWTADDLLAMLRDERARLDTLNWGDGRTRGIRASIESSYKRLTGEEQKFFAALGAFAGDDFDARAAAYVTETEDAQCRERLERFLRLSLAQEGRRALRYRLHPLLRDYAREVTTDKDEKNGRMASHYLAVAQDADRNLKSQKGFIARQTLDDEIDNIRGAVTWARNNPRQTTWEFLRGIAYAMDDYLEFRGYWNERLEWLKYGRDASQELDDSNSVSNMLVRIGLVYADKGEWDKAIEFYQQSLVIYEKVGDVHGMAQTYNNLGLVYADKGEWDKAIEFYQQSLVTKEKVGDVHGMAQTFGNLGLVYADKGEWDKAIEFYQNALRTMEKVGDVHGMAQTYNNLGIVYRQKGEWDKAIEFYQNALRTMEKVGDVVGISATYWNMGSLFEERGDIPKAIEFVEKAVAIKEKIGHPLLKQQREHLDELRKKLT